MQKTVFGVLFVLLVSAHEKFASGTIIQVSGDIEIISSPPSDLRSNMWENDLYARVFEERRAFTLVTPLTVDATLPGTVRVAPGDLSPATLEIGTVLNSYYFHNDVVGTPQNSSFKVGSITFDSEIIGVIAGVKDGMSSSNASNSLGLSNSILGLPGILYSTERFDLLPQDEFTIAMDRRSLSFRSTVGRFDDNLRIITRSVPEPSALVTWLLLWFVSVLFVLRRTPRQFRISQWLGVQTIALQAQPQSIAPEKNLGSIQEVMTEGLDATANEALKDAFQNAVQQVVRAVTRRNR